MNIALTSQNRKDNNVLAYVLSAFYAALTLPLPLLQIKGAWRFRVAWKRYWPSVRRLPATHRERASERLDAYVSRKLKMLVRYPCLAVFPALTAEAGDRSIGLRSALHSPGRRPPYGTDAEPAFLHSDTTLSCADVLRLPRGCGLPAPAQLRPAPVRGDVQTICTSRRGDRVAHGRRTPGRDRRALRRKGGLYVGGRDRPGGERGLRVAGLEVASCTEGGRRGRLSPKPKHMPSKGARAPPTASYIHGTRPPQCIRTGSSHGTMSNGGLLGWNAFSESTRSMPTACACVQDPWQDRCAAAAAPPPHFPCSGSFSLCMPYLDCALSAMHPSADCNPSQVALAQCIKARPSAATPC
jgi:hypothetical protein